MAPAESSRAPSPSHPSRRNVIILAKNPSTSANFTEKHPKQAKTQKVGSHGSPGPTVCCYPGPGGSGGHSKRHSGEGCTGDTNGPDSFLVSDKGVTTPSCAFTADTVGDKILFLFFFFKGKLLIGVMFLQIPS